MDDPGRAIHGNTSARPSGDQHPLVLVLPWRRFTDGRGRDATRHRWTGRSTHSLLAATRRRRARVEGDVGVLLDQQQSALGRVGAQPGDDFVDDPVPQALGWLVEDRQMRVAEQRARGSADASWPSEVNVSATDTGTDPLPGGSTSDSGQVDAIDGAGNVDYSAWTITVSGASSPKPACTVGMCKTRERMRAPSSRQRQYHHLSPNHDQGVHRGGRPSDTVRRASQHRSRPGTDERALAETAFVTRASPAATSAAILRTVAWTGNYYGSDSFGHKQVSHGVYTAFFNNPTEPGDSGSPVFDTSGRAIGISVAARISDRRYMFFSQIEKAEAELNVQVYCGGTPCARASLR
ncbi:MAG: hypothetical protein JO042_14590 [Sinobacteraceae bacterium]|nr:hypothetical protein [Nevskiaceae bacterium]